MQKRFDSYRRVSTQKQGISGLGLEAQEGAVAQYVSHVDGVLLKDFVEVESGKANDRPQLHAAISFAKRSQATLLVAKLDRLSRNVAFLATLLESKVDFLAVDNPHATPFTIHIMAAVAQWEREAISKRTREAMAIAKTRGSKFASARPGHWEGREERRKAGAIAGGTSAAVVNRQLADEAYRDVAPEIIRQRQSGMSLQKIADDLNHESIPTRMGKKWTKATVRLVLLRFEPDPPPKIGSAAGYRLV